jgi:hypothetical protein
MGSPRQHAMERRQKPKGLGLPVGNRRRPTGTPVPQGMSPRRKSSPEAVAKARAAYAEMMKRRAEARNKRPSSMTPTQARTAYAEMMRRRVEARNKQKPTGTPVPQAKQKVPQAKQEVPQAKQKPTGTPKPPKRRSRGRRPDTARTRAAREFNANRLKSNGSSPNKKRATSSRTFART